MKSTWVQQVTLEMSGEEVVELLTAYADVYRAVHSHVPSDAIEESSMLRLDKLFRELDFYDSYEFKS